MPPLSEKGHQGHPRATSKWASWQEQEVPSEHSSFLLSAEVTGTCLNSHTERGQMPCCQASFYSLFPTWASANVSPLHPSPSHWRQPLFRAPSCINTVWVIPDPGSSRVRLHLQPTHSAFPSPPFGVSNPRTLTSGDFHPRVTGLTLVFLVSTSELFVLPGNTNITCVFSILMHLYHTQRYLSPTH